MRKGALSMRILTVLRKSAQVYLKNFTDLMGAYLVEALLRAMCFVPLMFLLLPETAVWAWLCVPMYVFIALPARQNYAIAMQDMLYGGRVFSPRLISFDGYWRKLGRGVAGTLKLLCWMAQAICRSSPEFTSPCPPLLSPLLRCTTALAGGTAGISP